MPQNPIAQPLDPSQDQWANYLTPAQAQAQREYANALLYGKGQQNVQSPWQGLSNMTSALIGGNRLYQTGQQDRQSDLYDASRLAKNPFEGQQDNTGAASGPQASGTAASVRNNNPGAQWPGPVASQYGATGSQNVAGGNKIASFDDPVKGAAAEMALLEKNYSGMPLGAAVSKWSGGNSAPAYASYIAKNTGLSPDTVITPQLLRGPQGIALAKTMANWEAGGQYPMNDQQWEQAHQLAFGQPTGGQALAFSGQPAGPGGNAPDAPSAIAQALAPRSPSNAPSGNPVGAAPKPMAPVGQESGQTYIDPGLTPRQPQQSRGDFVNTMASHRLSPQIQELMTNMYYGQGQPMQMQYPGGNVLINPRNPSQQQFLPTPQEEKVGSPTGDVPRTFQIVPDGKGGFIKQIMPVAGQGGVTKPAQPPAEAPPSLDNFGTNAPIQPEAPSAAPPPAGFVPPPKPQSMNEGGLPSNALAFSDEPPATAAQAATQGAGLSVGSPPRAESPPTMLGAGPPPGTGIKTAQAYDPNTEAIIDQGIQKKIQLDSGVERAKQQAELYGKKYEQLQDTAQSARQGLSQLQFAKDMTYDPNFYSGVGSNLALDLKRIQSQIGKNPNAARAMEMFQKLTSGNIINDMRSSFSGLGQIRLAEIQLLGKANGNLDNTPAANRAVLDVLSRAHQQAANIGQLANSYAQGWRWDAKGNPYRDPNAQPGLDYGWDQTLQKWTDKHPLFSDDEIKNYNNFFTKVDPKRAAAGEDAIRNIPGVTVAGSPTTKAPPPPPAGFVPVPKQ